MTQLQLRVGRVCETDTPLLIFDLRMAPMVPILGVCEVGTKPELLKELEAR